MPGTAFDPAAGWGKPPASLALTQGEVHVWRVPLALDAAEIGRLIRGLLPEEKDRAARFHFQKDRDHFIAARARLRIVLGHYLGIPAREVCFGYGARGKPFLAARSAGLEFNVAHSHDLALFAVTRNRQIGVDIEYIKRDITGDEIAERFFSRREVAVLNSLPAARNRQGFFNCWTRKEAYIKAVGEGLAFGLDQFTVSLAPGEAAALLETPFDLGEARRWWLHHLEPGPGYVGALAVRGAVSALSCWRYPSEWGDNV